METETCTVNKLAILEFTKPGRRTNVVINIAPVGWLLFNAKTKIMQVKYMEGPFNDEKRRILYEKIKNEENPPNDWQLRNVRIISQARKFLKIIVNTKYAIIEATLSLSHVLKTQ